MHTILLYANGRRAEGIILSASKDMMRVAVDRKADAVELRRAGGVWTAEDGSRIEFESLVIAGNTGIHGGPDFETRPRTFAAGAQAYLPV